MTEQEIKIKLSKQVNPGEEPMNPELFTIKSTECAGENDCAIKVVFDYGKDYIDVNAVIYEDDPIYEDGICFSSYDWDLPADERWFDYEHQLEGIVLNDLPRIF